MTKEIKFRAWDKKGKFMVDSEYWLLLDGNGQIFEFNLGKMSTKTNEYEIMQFTGLLDKNGKEVYEGDLLKWKDGRTFEVRRDDVGWTLCNDLFFGGHCGVSHTKSYIRSSKIIGNVYEGEEQA